MEINVFEENGRKESVDQADQVGEAEIECIIGVSRQVIIIFILRNWWGILQKKEIIKNMKVNTVLTLFRLGFFGQSVTGGGGSEEPPLYLWNQ